MKPSATRFGSTGLDSGLMRMLRTMFQEPHPAEDVRLYNSPADTTLRNPGLLAPPGQPLNRWCTNGPRRRRALAEMLAGQRQSAIRRQAVWNIAIRPPAARRSRLFPAGSKCSTAETGDRRASPHLEPTLLRGGRQRRLRGGGREAGLGSRRLFRRAQLVAGTIIRIPPPRPRCCFPPPTGRCMKRSACIVSRAGRFAARK